jgi:hypothetical protein
MRMETVLGRTFVPQTAEVTVSLECLDEDAEKMQLESYRNGGMLRTAFIPASARVSQWPVANTIANFRVS